MSLTVTYGKPDGDEMGEKWLPSVITEQMLFKGAACHVASLIAVTEVSDTCSAKPFKECSLGFDARCTCFIIGKECRG